MSEKYKGVAVVCKKDYLKKGLEVGDYFPTHNYTDKAIDEAIERGDLEIETNQECVCFDKKCVKIISRKNRV